MSEELSVSTLGIDPLIVPLRCKHESMLECRSKQGRNRREINYPSWATRMEPTEGRKCSEAGVEQPFKVSVFG